MNQTALTAGAPRSLLWIAALVYTTFVIYGSLVPLDYRPMPWDVATNRFSHIPFLALGMGSRADWVANLLLFIPLTFLWMGALTSGKPRVYQAMFAIILIPTAIMLSFGIEFTQLFFPPRTVSQNDIMAEGLGGILGVLAWWGSGPRFTVWLQSWQRHHARAAIAEKLAWVYLAGVLVYNVLPLDLTLSLVELFHKWRSGNLNLIPFGRLPDGAANALYELVTDALIWVPLALLWRMDGTRTAGRAWMLTVATAMLLEFLQLFVYSRVSDVTDVFTAAAGAAFGSTIGGSLARREAARHSMLPWLSGFPFVLALGWMAILGLVFWFPFDFRTDGAFVKSRLDFIYRVPFEVYYFGTEYRAITEVLRKTLFFAPLGALLAWGVARQPWRWRGPLFAASMLVLVAMPAVIELGQVMLPLKYADTTDWFLAWLGGLAGYGVLRRLLRAPRLAPPPEMAVPAEVPEPTLSCPATRWHVPLGLLGLGGLFVGVAYAPWVPYNVRELFRRDVIGLSALLLAGTSYWLAVWPVWLARRRVSGMHRLWQLPLGLGVYGGLSFLMLYAAVPEESLHDVVGSPVLGWGGHWEIALRWIALAAIPGTMLYLAAQTARRWRGRKLGTMPFLSAIPVLAGAFWGVVVQADTDNLIELMATPHLLAFMALCAWLFIVFFSAALIASPAAARQRRLRAVSAVGLLPVAALLLSVGLADEINKYDQQFSALQFLLSADRQHYATQTVIWLRYSALHLLVIAALAFLQWPYFRTSRRPEGPSAHAFH